MEVEVHDVIVGGKVSGDNEKAVVAVGDESVHIKEEVGLEGPEALEDDGTSKGKLNSEEVGLEG